MLITSSLALNLKAIAHSLSDGTLDKVLTKSTLNEASNNDIVKLLWMVNESPLEMRPVQELIFDKWNVRRSFDRALRSPDAAQGFLTISYLLGAKYRAYWASKNAGHNSPLDTAFLRAIERMETSSPASDLVFHLIGHQAISPALLITQGLIQQANPSIAYALLKRAQETQGQTAVHLRKLLLDRLPWETILWTMNLDIEESYNLASLLTRTYEDFPSNRRQDSPIDREFREAVIQMDHSEYARNLLALLIENNAITPTLFFSDKLARYATPRIAVALMERSQDADFDFNGAFLRELRHFFTRRASTSFASPASLPVGSPFLLSLECVPWSKNDRKGPGPYSERSTHESILRASMELSS